MRFTCALLSLFFLASLTFAAEMPPQSTLAASRSVPQSTLSVSPADPFAVALRRYCACPETGECVCPPGKCACQTVAMRSSGEEQNEPPAQTTITAAPTDNPWRYDATRNILWRYGSDMTGCSTGACAPPAQTYSGAPMYYSGEPTVSYGVRRLFGGRLGSGGCAGGS